MASAVVSGLRVTGGGAVTTSGLRVEVEAAAGAVVVAGLRVESTGSNVAVLYRTATSWVPVEQMHIVGVTD